MKLYLVETSDGKFVTDADFDIITEARASYVKRKMKNSKNIMMDQLVFKATLLPTYLDTATVVRRYLPNQHTELTNNPGETSHEFGE